MFKALIFVAFLIASVLWFLASFFVLAKNGGDLVEDRLFWPNQRMLLLSNIPFFLFVYLLSGFWSTRLFVLYFVAGEVGVISSFLLSALLGGEGQGFGPRVVWAGKELEMEYPVISKVLQGLALASLLAYFVVASVFYFRHPWGSRELSIPIIKYSLLLLIFVPYPTVLVPVMSMLSSDNLDEETRQHIFINQLGGMVPMVLFVAMVLWAFGVGTGVNAVPLAFPVFSQTLSLRVLLILAAVFAAAILFPYLIGSHRSRNLNEGLLKKRQQIVRDLTNILESPTGPQYNARLTQVSAQVTAMRADFIAHDVVLKKLEDPKFDQPEILARALQRSKDADPRFEFLNDLALYETEIQEVIGDLQRRAATDVEAAAARWAEKFKSRKADLLEELEEARAVRSAPTVWVGTAAATIISGILGEVGKVAWTTISNTLPK